MGMPADPQGQGGGRVPENVCGWRSVPRKCADRSELETVAVLVHSKRLASPSWPSHPPPLPQGPFVRGGGGSLHHTDNIERSRLPSKPPSVACRLTPKRASFVVCVGGAVAIKAERIGWLVLAGVCTHSPVEEGILHLRNPNSWGV